MRYSSRWPRVRRGLSVLAVLVFAAACASAGAGGGGGGSGNTITREQFSPDDENAYLIVRRLRPAWLRPRTQDTPGASQGPAFAQVFVDETQVGDVDYLYRISATQIDRIEYLSALDATTRFGTGFVGGLIIVRTINSRPG